MGILKKHRRVFFIWTLLVVMMVAFALLAPSFLSSGNILSVLQNSLEIAVIAIGVTIVFIIGGADMTVGASLGVQAIIAGWMIQAGQPPVLVALAAVTAGIGVGMVNGILIAFGGIPDMIATIGVMYMLRAAIFIMLGGRWLTGVPDVFGALTKGMVAGTPLMLWVLLLMYLVAALLLRYTKIGREVYAVGSNEAAAKLVGIRIKKVKIFSYALVGALTGLASLLYLGRLGSVEITIGADLHMQVIAAVVIGGTSVLGGSGNVLGTLAGVFIMAVLRNGINLMGIPSLWERVFIGFFLLLSVAIDMLTRRKKA